MLKSIGKGVSSVLEGEVMGWIVVAVGGFFAFRLLNRTGGLVGKVKDSIDKAVIGDKVKKDTGVDSPTYDLGYDIALKVSLALGTKKDLPWYNTVDEDEETAADQLNRINSKQVADVVKQVYERLTGYDLYFHVDKYFDWVQIRWVNDSVISYIK